MSLLFRREGRCPVCEQRVQFEAWDTALRDTYLCDHCGSIPRERALAAAVQRFFPNWRALAIHESSPSNMAFTRTMARECPQYVATHYDAARRAGEMHPDGWRNEDLAAQTFGDASFDLVITQDVFEHVFHPAPAIREIARTLRPGGAHVCTVPLVRGVNPSVRRASLTARGVEHHAPATFHHNPIDPTGSLVTIDWGYDIAAFFSHHAPSLATTILFQEEPDRGIQGPLTEVVMSAKLPAPAI